MPTIKPQVPAALEKGRKKQKKLGTRTQSTKTKFHAQDVGKFVASQHFLFPESHVDCPGVWL